MTFIEVIPGIYQFKDVINVYVIKKDNHAILIDFGSGNILNHLDEIGITKIDYIFHTHYHRDQCSGDIKALEQNIKIAVPNREKKLFFEAEKFWKVKSYYDIYYFKPTFFVSTYNIPIDLTFKNGQTFEWDQIQIKAIETSGHTTGSMSFIVKSKDKILAFTGDLIHFKGKIITYYDLHYIYADNGENGIKRSLKSFKKLLRQKPDMLLPSHGDAINEPKKEIDILTEKFEKARFIFNSKHGAVGLPLVFYNLFHKKLKPIKIKDVFPSILKKGASTTFIVLGSNQNCFLIDYAGSNLYFGLSMKDLNKILKKNNVKSIDFIIPSHYHDDHIAGIPNLQNKLDIKVFALENMVNILENPTHYRIPCLIDTSIKVDKIFKDGEELIWDNYKFKIYHFPGQTEYHMGLFGEIDGKTIFFVGDSMTLRTLIDRDLNVISHNICKLGSDLGYVKCAKILLECNPEYLAINHSGIIKVSQELLKFFDKIVSEYESTISDLVAQEDPNMGFDPNWICFKPIRVITEPGSVISTNLSVRNYLEKESRIKYELNLPENWSSNDIKGEILIQPKSSKEIPIKIRVPAEENPVGRTILTANVQWNGKDLGPFPDLMVDHGYIPSHHWTGWTPEKKPGLFMWAVKSVLRYRRIFK